MILYAKYNELAHRPLEKTEMPRSAWLNGERNGQSTRPDLIPVGINLGVALGNFPKLVSNRFQTLTWRYNGTTTCPSSTRLVASAGTDPAVGRAGPPPTAGNSS
jgi:hypothetical protein